MTNNISNWMVIKMTYDEYLSALKNTNTVSDECWVNICDRISYDAASSVPGAIIMLTIIKQKTADGEIMVVPAAKIVFTQDNFDKIILELFGDFILSEIKGQS